MILVVLIFVMILLVKINGSDKYSDRELKQEIIQLTDPDIFLIGAMKSGTTSFHNLLVELAENRICGYGEKEKHFFNSGSYVTQYSHHVLYYNREFEGCTNTQLTMDSTPGYSVNNDTLSRIVESYSKANLAKKKIVLLLREPVARHYSEYQMYIRLCKDLSNDLGGKKDLAWSAGYSRIDRWKDSCHRVAVDPHWAKGKRFDNPQTVFKPEVMTFNQWITSETGLAELRRGRYYELLNKWLSVFTREQVYIVNFGTLITNTTTVIQKFFKYVDLDSVNVKKAVLPTPSEKHKVTDTIFDCESVNILYKYFARENKGLMEILKSPKKSRWEPEFGQFDDPRKRCVGKSNVDANSYDDDFFKIISKANIK